MGRELCLKAVKALARALNGYLRTNARRTVEISSLTGQREVKVSERALFRYHDPTTGFPLISEALSVILDRAEWLSNIGWRVRVIDGETHFIIPLKQLRDMLSMNEDDIYELLINAGACSEG